MATSTEILCGTSVSQSCAQVELPMTPAGWQLLVSEAVDAASFILSASLQSMSQGYSINQIRAVNAGRCMVLSLGENFWTWIASAYYFSKQFGFDQDVVTYVRTFYPYVCTCNQDANTFARILGGNQRTASIMSACSEAAQQLKLQQNSNSSS